MTIDKLKLRIEREAKYAAAQKPPKPTKHGAKTDRAEKPQREDRWR